MSNQNNDDQSGRKSARGSEPTFKRNAADTETEARMQVEEARRRAKEEAEAEERSQQDKQSASRRNDGGGQNASRKRKSKGSSGKQNKPKSKGGDSDGGKKQGGQAKKEKIDHVTRKLREDNDTLEAEDRGDIDPLEYGVEWLEAVLEGMNFDVEVDSRSEDDRLYFDVSGQDAEVLLGLGSNKPRSVEALQTLLSAAIGRYTESRKITLDVGGFRDARSEDLEDVARQLGEHARRVNKSITIAGYKNHERRVIHDTLKGDKRLKTESTGDGIFRKISIKPK